MYYKSSYSFYAFYLPIILVSSNFYLLRLIPPYLYMLAFYLISISFSISFFISFFIFVFLFLSTLLFLFPFTVFLTFITKTCLQDLVSRCAASARCSTLYKNFFCRTLYSARFNPFTYSLLHAVRLVQYFCLSHTNYYSTYSNVALSSDVCHTNNVQDRKYVDVYAATSGQNWPIKCHDLSYSATFSLVHSIHVLLRLQDVVNYSIYL